MKHLLSAILLALLAGPSVQAEPADLVFRNADVVTMDSLHPAASAVAIRGDRIIAVGDDDEIQKWIGEKTGVRDLGGRTILPGFYAPHDHLPGAGVLALFHVNLGSPPMGPVEDIDDLIAALRARAEATPKGEWIGGRGYDDTLMKEGRHPTRYDLDIASSEHPIYIRHTSGHLGVANSLALEIGGVTKDTPQPKGGVIRKDSETGEPNGVFEESGGQVSRHIPSRTREQQLETIRWSSDHYASKGVTTACIASGSVSRVNRLVSAADDGLLKIRITSMTSGARAESGYNIDEDEKRIRLGAVKLMADGSIQGFTGYLGEPYHTPFDGDSDYRGYPRQDRERLVDRVKALHRRGLQVAVHGNGDAAIDDILYAFAEAQKEYPREDARHRIEHCQMAREDQLDRMSEMGISPSFFVGHVYYWGDRHRDIFMGPERARRISPLASALRRGIRFTVHDDTPVTPVDPLRLVWTAVNRTTREDKVLGPEQRLTPEAALRAVTIDAAWQNFEDKFKGSIEPGKLADLVILEENPLLVEASRIKDIRILETIVGGETIHANE